MSKITLAPNASGTGTLTVAAPNTNTDYTLTLPTATTTLVGTDASQTLTNKSIAASQLTGALPAIDGSALTGIASMTLLGTIATTSGTSVTLSGLTLTSYKQVQFVVNEVSGTGTAGTSFLQLNSLVIGVLDLGVATQSLTGGGEIDLATGSFWGSARNSQQTGSGYAFGGASGLTTASTSITFTLATGAFDAGSITIYGVK
jgi:hypothetical protein